MDNKTQQEIYLIKGNMSEVISNVKQALEKMYIDIKHLTTKNQITAKHRRLNAIGAIVIDFIPENNNTIIEATITEKRGSWSVKITPKQKMLNNFTRYLQKESILENRSIVESVEDKRLKISEISSLNEQILEAIKLRNTYFKEIQEEKTQGPRKPASQNQIDEVEKTLGLKLPLSYRNFLLQHNGWEEFDVCMNLFSCEELLEYFDSKKEKEFKTIAIEDGGDKFIKDCIVIGTSSENSTFYLLDPNREYNNGEYAIIEFGDEEDECFKSFVDFLIPDNI